MHCQALGAGKQHDGCNAFESDLFHTRSDNLGVFVFSWFSCWF